MRSLTLIHSVLSRSLMALFLVAFTIDSLNLPDLLSRSHPMVCSSEDIAIAGIVPGQMSSRDRSQDHRAIIPQGGKSAVPVLEQTVLVDEDSPGQIDPSSDTNFISREPIQPLAATDDQVPPSAPLYLRLRALLI